MAEQKDQVVTVKVSAEIYEMIKRGCDEEKKSISEYLRSCIIRDRYFSGDVGAKKIVHDNVGKALSGVGKATKDMIEKAVNLVIGPSGEAGRKNIAVNKTKRIEK